jgi:hypothetical protein
VSASDAGRGGSNAVGVAPVAAVLGSAGAIVTVVAGRVTGEIIRSIFDGGTVQEEAHIAIDGHRRPPADVAIQTDAAPPLRDLAAVGAFLAEELAAQE